MYFWEFYLEKFKSKHLYFQICHHYLSKSLIFLFSANIIKQGPVQPKKIIYLLLINLFIKLIYLLIKIITGFKLFSIYRPVIQLFMKSVDLQAFFNFQLNKMSQ